MLSFYGSQAFEHNLEQGQATTMQQDHPMLFSTT